MRVRAAIGTLALAGTVLLGGAAQALADDNDDMGNVGGDVGSNSPAMSDAGQGASDDDQGASDDDKGATGFGQVGAIFDRSPAANG
jgi:hypothetical protein